MVGLGIEKKFTNVIVYASKHRNKALKASETLPLCGVPRPEKEQIYHTFLKIASLPVQKYQFKPK
jgi:hypothetical protein